MKKYFLLLIVTLILFKAQGQLKNSEDVNLIYKNAIELLEKNKLFAANAEFEKVIVLDPNHKDALYNLAIISGKLGDNSSAVRFLQRGVRLNDKKAAKLLVSKYHYKLSYADTMQNIDASTRAKYTKLKSLQASSLNDLANEILSMSSSKKEQLQILLLWTYDNMTVDSVRFFNGGNPLSNNEAFTKRIGLCDEYSNIMSEFCTIAKIPNFKVAGYVKYPSFTPGDNFNEANHAWNAVYLDSAWVHCDLFWSTVALTDENTSVPHFIKRLETNYFLSHPTIFINDHLPCDPVFQFSNYPIVINSFTKLMEGIDTSISRMNYLNYKDSLSVLSKMNENDRMLQIARHSYEYNKHNPDDMIVGSYNYAADVLSNKTATKQELIKARKSLTMALRVIDTSKDEEIRALKENCKSGIEMIDRRLTTNDY